MKKMVGAALVVAACSNRDAKPSPAPMSSVAQPELAPAQQEVVAAQAKRLAAMAKQLDDATSLDAAPAALTALHASDRWRRARAREGYKVVAPEALTNARARARELAAAFADVAHALDAARTTAAIATAMQPVSTAFDAAMHGGLGGLSSDVVDELVYDREHVCAKPGEPSCAQLPALEAAFDWLHDVVPHAGDELRGAATDLDAAAGALDTHLHVVLSRTAGTGPAFGAPCGPEQLCRWDHDCKTETATCEHDCIEVAMDPCPDGRTCRSIPALHGTFCR